MSEKQHNAAEVLPICQNFVLNLPPKFPFGNSAKTRTEDELKK